VTDNTRPAVSGAWRTATYADVTPVRSLPVDPAHLTGHYPDGKAPTELPVPDIPIVVVEGAASWGAYALPGEVAGWQRLGDTDTDSHVAYDVSTGVPFEVAGTEGMAWREADHGAVAGRLRALDEGEWEHRSTTEFGSPMAGGPGYQGGGISVRRGLSGLPLNNPDGIPGHLTPRVQRWGDPTRRFGPAVRTHHAHTLHGRWAWSSAPQTYTAGDLYGSPFDSNSVITTSGARTPLRQTVPGTWDQSITDSPLAATMSEDDQGFGGAFG
jgi:hypothetical protein